LVQALSTFGSGLIRSLRNPQAVKWHQNKLVLNHDVAVAAKCVIFCAGIGNQQFAKQLNIKIHTQQRQLRMVLIGPVKDELYAHFCEQRFSPELTITTHSAPMGKFWYVGGAVAERAGNQAIASVIEGAKIAIRGYLPFADLKHSRWTTHFVERAELAQENGKRPSSYSIHQHDRFLFAWPTKLCLVPKMCDCLCSRVLEIVGAPTGKQAPPPPEGLEFNAQFAVPPWYNNTNGSHTG
jgi:hypothetical protein